MERMRWTWSWALPLASTVGCKSQGPFRYTSFNAYSPGEPGSERLSASVVLPDGQEHSTNAVDAAARSVDGGLSFGARALEGSISGRVAAQSAGEVVVDTCDPSTGCAPTLYRLTATAPGLSLGIPVGREVSARWSFRDGWGSPQQVAILDGGGASMADGTRALRLWAVDPSLDTEVAGLLRVERQRLFCDSRPGPQSPDGGGGFLPGDYAFRFSAVSGGAEGALATGQTGTLIVATASGQQQHLTVHNLRSYQSEKCDDYWNWAWWAAGHAGPTGDPE